MLSVEPCLDILVVWINVIKNCICVYLVRSGEDDDLEVFVCFLEALHDVRSDVDTCIDSFFIGEVDLKDHIGILCFNVIDAVNECFVHVEYY